MRCCIGASIFDRAENRRPFLPIGASAANHISGSSLSISAFGEPGEITWGDKGLLGTLLVIDPCLHVLSTRIEHVTIRRRPSRNIFCTKGHDLSVKQGNDYMVSILAGNRAETLFLHQLVY